MHFYPEDRIMLFIDGANLSATLKALGFEVDYKRLLALFRERGRLKRALFYTTVFEDQEYSSVRPLVDWLEYNGYMLVTKPAKEIVDSDGRRRMRGTMNVELTVDAMRLSDQIDHAVIFSGDGSYRSLIAALQNLGKRVTVVSTLQTRPPMVADELRRQADEFVDLADLEAHISRVRAPSPAGDPATSNANATADPVSVDADFDGDMPDESGVGRSAVVVEKRNRMRTAPRK